MKKLFFRLLFSISFLFSPLKTHAVSGAVASTQVNSPTEEEGIIFFLLLWDGI